MIHAGKYLSWHRGVTADVLECILSVKADVKLALYANQGGKTYSAVRRGSYWVNCSWTETSVKIVTFHYRIVPRYTQTYQGDL